MLELFKPVPCPVCKQQPKIIPQSPKEEGYAWGEVRCSDQRHSVSIIYYLEDSDDRSQEPRIVAVNKWNLAFKQQSGDSNE
jgi:hypothetical protein